MPFYQRLRCDDALHHQRATLSWKLPLLAIPPMTIYASTRRGITRWWLILESSDLCTLHAHLLSPKGQYAKMPIETALLMCADLRFDWCDDLLLIERVIYTSIMALCAYFTSLLRSSNTKSYHLLLALKWGHIHDIRGTSRTECVRVTTGDEIMVIMLALRNQSPRNIGPATHKSNLSNFADIHFTKNIYDIR